MIDITKRKRILETACATGMHSELIAKNFMAPGALLVSTDFSPQMVQGMKERFDKSFLSKNKRMKIEVDFETDHTRSPDTMAMNLPQGEETEVKNIIIGCIADGMRLPFPD